MATGWTRIARRVGSARNRNTRVWEIAYWLGPFLSFLAIYFLTNIDSLSSADFSDYPFGADVPLYTFGVGHSHLHPLTARILGAYRTLLQDLGLHETAGIMKLPFAVFGALNASVAIAAFASLFDRARSLLFGACYGLSLIIWYFASVPESYALSALLYSLYLLIFLRSSTGEVSGAATLTTALVLLLALLNDVSAVVLLLIPAIYYGTGAFTVRRVRAYVGAQMGVLLLFLAVSVSSTKFMDTYLNLFRFYSPTVGASGQPSVQYHHGLLEPLLNFFFYAVAAPSDTLTYATAKFPHYVGFFEPSAFAYFHDAISIVFVLAYLALISFVRPARATRLILALAAFVAVRFLLVLLFNPGEAILYASVALLSLMVVLFHFLEAAQFSHKTAFATVLLLAIAGANIRFLS